MQGEFESEKGNVGIVAGSHEDILTAEKEEDLESYFEFAYLKIAKKEEENKEEEKKEEKKIDEGNKKPEMQKEIRFRKIYLQPIIISCHPLTYLMAFLTSIEYDKVEFTLMEMSNDKIKKEKKRFELNLEFRLFYGKVGAFFWIFNLFMITVLTFFFLYRALRIMFKRCAINKHKKEVRKSSEGNETENLIRRVTGLL